VGGCKTQSNVALSHLVCALTNPGSLQASIWIPQGAKRVLWMQSTRSTCARSHHAAPAAKALFKAACIVLVLRDLRLVILRTALEGVLSFSSSRMRGGAEGHRSASAVLTVFLDGFRPRSCQLEAGLVANLDFTCSLCPSSRSVILRSRCQCSDVRPEASLTWSVRQWLEALRISLGHLHTKSPAH